MTTLNGASFGVGSKLVDNEPDILDGQINESRSDIDLENGIVHVISRVLLPIDL